MEEIHNRKRVSRIYPRDDEIVEHSGDIIDALEKLKNGEIVFVCSRKLSILIRRFGETAFVRPLRWRGKSIFRVEPVSEN
ncbi:MAG: hypothetical protein ACUVXA_01585 [Candidatus Jordarchaeum sp.]|uniref:hypothetical protein n=1 Tax=Candidatus Jordarchaeum sp. TaxID=2823881 RepID=UPI00404ADEE7